LAKASLQTPVELLTKYPDVHSVQVFLPASHFKQLVSQASHLMVSVPASVFFQSLNPGLQPSHLSAAAWQTAHLPSPAEDEHTSQVFFPPAVTYLKEYLNNLVN
jgi:hypothetical protein